MKTTLSDRSSSAPATHGIIIVSLLALFLPLSASDPDPHHPPPPPYSPYPINTRVDPSMAVVIAVLFIAFFFAGFFSICFRRRAGAGAGSTGTVRPAARSRHVARGVDPSVIETFPTFIYSEVKDLKFGKEALECAVCLSEFEENETLRMLPNCSHVFHPDCIDTWLTSHTTCPVCRFNLGAAATTLEATPADVPDHVTSDHVAINVDEADPNEDLSLIRNQMQSGRMRSRFLRSHTTGHSTAENLERYTLRLPEHAKKSLNRTISCVAYSTANGGSRRGNKSGGEGSSRGRSFRFARFDRWGFSDRWVFSRTRPLFLRTLSVTAQERGDGEVAAKAKVFLRSLTMPLNCFGAKGDSVERTSAVGSARV